MKRGLTVLACLCAIVGAQYFAISKWGIRHESLDLFDAARQRPVSVDVAVRWDYERKADAGYWKLPVAIISNGNTVKNTEYSFLANVFAARGYMVVSIQQDNPSDPPLVTKLGMPYVGRLDVYKKGEANILFAIDQLKKRDPNADYDHLTLVGHSNGGDTAMYFAKQHPDLTAKVVTLDNLRVPFVVNDKMKILSFRSEDPHFQTDPDCGLFLVSLKAGGLGLNLTAAEHVFLLDPWWNPAAEAQAIDRAHRIGQSRHVLAFRLIAKDTVEEKVLQLQQGKRELAEAIIGQDNSVISTLGRTELELLLSWTLAGSLH